MGSFLGMGGTMLLMAAALALPVLAPLAPLCAVVGINKEYIEQDMRTCCSCVLCCLKLG